MHDIDWSCPADLRPYEQAYRLEKQKNDNDAWLTFGTYGISALTVAIDRCLNGRKARSKYIEKPIMQELEEKNKPLSEEEMDRQRELFVAKLEAMRVNFELNHKKKEDDKK